MIKHRVRKWILHRGLEICLATSKYIRKCLYKRTKVGTRTVIFYKKIVNNYLKSMQVNSLLKTLYLILKNSSTKDKRIKKFQGSICLLKPNNRKKSKMCLNSTIKTPKRLHCQLWTYVAPFPCVSVVDFEHVFVRWTTTQIISAFRKIL